MRCRASSCRALSRLELVCTVLIVTVLIGTARRREGASGEWPGVVRRGAEIPDGNDPWKESNPGPF